MRLGECFGANIDCVSDPVLLPYEAGPTISCHEEAKGAGSVVFRTETTDVACPNPPCAVAYEAIQTASDGSLNLIGPLQLASNDIAGIWLARFSPGGDLLRESVGEFAVPSRLALPRSFAIAGFDAAQSGYVTELVGRPDGPRQTTLYRYAANATAPLALKTYSNVVSSAVTVAPDGGFVTHTEWWANGFDSGAQDGAAKQLALSRYDPSGRLLWNQPKLSRALDLTGVQPIGFDAAGNLFLELERETGNFVTLPDHTMLGLQIDRLAQIDRDGNLRWLVELPSSFSTSFALAPSGVLYVWRRPLERGDGGIYQWKPGVLEKFDQAGRSGWVQEAPSQDPRPQMTVDATGDLIFVTSDHDASSPTPKVTFHHFLAQGDLCDAFDVDLKCPASQSTPCNAPITQPGPEGSMYFATSDAVGRVAQP
ncbi:MAG TPA: hypothetical protein VHU80_06780 [Polyangiaceae bacterium]|nr:hypothetical protein [Polyangiaceae bacterium]